MNASPWVAMSAMQKAIRRGREDLALSGAATLLRDAPDKLWRRLGCIAYEDGPDATATYPQTFSPNEGSSHGPSHCDPRHRRGGLALLVINWKIAALCPHLGPRHCNFGRFMPGIDLRLIIR
jgi:hypothetical protein